MSQGCGPRKRTKSTRQRGELSPNLPRNLAHNLLHNLTPDPALALRCIAMSLLQRVGKGGFRSGLRLRSGSDKEIIGVTSFFAPKKVTPIILRWVPRTGC